MENWDLRHDQVRSIVGTNEPRRLSEIADAAREHMDRQPAASIGGARWEFVGPTTVTGQAGQTTVAGHITALAIDPRDPRRLYAGSAAGVGTPLDRLSVLAENPVTRWLSALCRGEERRKWTWWRG